MKKNCNRMAKTFEKRELVWGKLQGYPWWPAFVNSLLPNKIELVFFGDFSRAFVRLHQVKKIDEMPVKRVKQKQLKASIS